MNKKILTITGFAIAAAIVSTMAVNGQAGLLDTFRKNRHADIKETSQRMVGGTYSGSLAGEIRLDGEKVLITDKTMVYVIGKGVVRGRSLTVQGRAVAARGETVGNVLVANTIIVRPEAHVATHRAGTGPNAKRPTTPGVNPYVAIAEKWDGE